MPKHYGTDSGSKWWQPRKMAGLVISIDVQEGLDTGRKEVVFLSLDPSCSVDVMMSEILKQFFSALGKFYLCE